MTTTPSTLKRLFVGPDAKYAQTGVDEDVLRVAGRNGDILVVNSDEDDGDTVTLNAAVRVKGGGVYDVRAFGAKGDGTTNDLAAVNSAIVAANALTTGGEVFLPAGTYRIIQGGAVGAIRPKSNVTLRGAGMGRTIIWCDDAGGGTDCIGNNINNTSSYDALSNFHVRDLTIKGRADVTPTQGAQLVRIKGDDLSFERVELTYSRLIGMVITESNRVYIRGCKVFRTSADGIYVSDSSAVLISDNEITQANDDAISAHSNDSASAPVRSGVIIKGNRITESQGIAVLGVKAVSITNNILRRIMCTGVRVRSPGTDVQGQTPQFSLRVSENIIEDVFQRSEPNPRNSAKYYIMLSGGIRRAGGGAAPPGEVDPATGTAVSFYGSNNSGVLYANETGSGGSPAPAGFAIDIVNNTFVRTLPAVTTVSQWGYASSSGGLWVGNNGDGSGYYNGAISEASLNATGIAIDPALWNSRIAGNIIQTTGAYGIEFRTVETIANMDFAGLRIEANKIVDFSSYAIGLPASATKQRIWILNNEFDADPRHVHPNRKTGPHDGSWLTSGQPGGVYGPNVDGLTIEGNHFRNLCVPLEDSGSSKLNLVRGNYCYSEPASLGFSTSNKGVGTIFRTGIQGRFIHIHEDCTPTSATYGQILTNPHVAFTAMPSTGTYVAGHFVYNTAPGAGGYLGWVRLTTGNAHVLNTDWKPAGAIV